MGTRIDTPPYAGVLAIARLTGPLPTPADGFALDLEELERATEELLRAESEGWSVDVSSTVEPYPVEPRR